MAEALTIFLTVQDPLGDETENTIEEAFDDLDLRLAGIGEVARDPASGDSLYERSLA